MTGLVLAIVLTSPRLHSVHEAKQLFISQLKPRPRDPLSIAGDSGDLTRPMRGFNTHGL